MSRPTTSQPAPVAPEHVRETLGKYLIADGFPIVFDLKRSHGAWVVDATSGKPYIDFYSFFASLPLGFQPAAFHTSRNRERLYAAAVHKPSNSDADSVELATFVETFARHAMPSPFRHLFFIEGGALAVENALKTAFDWKVRKNLAAGRAAAGAQVLHFEEAFHGRTGYTLSLTNTLPIKVRHFPKFSWPRITNPKLRFPVDAAELERVARQEEQTLAQARKAFETNPHDIAAIIIEPIQGEGGDNHFRGEFLRALRALADEHDALLIFDEVQTGFGLTGRFWAWEHFGAIPDVVCFGKKSQVCGIMAGPRIDEVPDNVFRVSSRLNSTWGGSLVDMVRCEIILEVMQQEQLLERVVETGAELNQRLAKLAEEFPKVVSGVRGRGLLCAFDCPDATWRQRILAAALDEGVLLLPCGERSIRLRPALVITSEEISEAHQRIRKAIQGLK